jgi:hypothetical protein
MLVVVREAIGSGRGHPSIRASHGKTLELVRDGAVGARATCVVAVGVELDEDALLRLSGPAELELSVGAVRDVVRGRINPAYRAGDRLVARRAGAATRDAFLIDADKAASDLDRALVAALADPAAVVAIGVREVGRERVGTLVVAGDAAWGGSLAPEDAADRVASPDAALARLADGERVAVGSATPVLVRAARDAGHIVLPSAGQPPIAAALAVAGVDTRSVVVTTVDDPTAWPELARGCVVLPSVPLDRALEWLDAWSAQADATGVLGVDLGTPREQWLPWRSGEGLDVAGDHRRRVLAVAVAPRAKALGPAAEALARELLARGATTADVSRLLQRTTGLPRRTIYDALLRL